MILLTKIMLGIWVLGSIHQLIILIKTEWEAELENNVAKVLIVCKTILLIIIGVLIIKL